MKKIKLIFTLVALAFLAGCAAGVNFKKMGEDQLVLGETKKSTVLAVMGEPSGKGTSTFNGIELDIINYAYAKVGANAVLPDVTAARAQGFLFNNGKLVGKEYTSSFAEDNTLFSVEKAKTIKRGQSKAKVRAIMGKPRGGYLYPIIDDKNGTAYVYLFTQTIGFKSKSDLFVVEFNNKGKVTKTKLTSNG
ncbi:MAG: outer membrane protein assembly factor BamE [Gammaproteobacteria bacterium]|nr:outer membrane protein assembly factor BamE [Gammaproteobacteria bacterium]MCW9030909.1 outer membrane protein assembly factor BamE [Gammaproteobacteria bacterium]